MGTRQVQTTYSRKKFDCSRLGISDTLLRVEDELERDPYNTTVAEVINEIYEANGSPLAATITKSGVSKNTILRYLSGERDIRVGELRKIAAALNVTLAQVMAEADRRFE